MNGNESTDTSTHEIYPLGSHGPYGVWVRDVIYSDKPFDIFKIGELIYDQYNSVTEVKKDGRYKGVILFKNRDEANNALKNPVFAKNGMRTFIPGFRMQRRGVLRGIPIDISTDKLEKGIVASAKVNKVVRLNRKNKKATSEENRWVPTTSVLVIFDGDQLPSEVSFFYVKLKVEPFINNPRLCFNCFQFGHLAKKCRNDKRCPMCGEKEHDGDCVGIVPRCRNCKGSHKSIDSKCETYQKNREVNRMMALDNISYSEAYQVVFNNSPAPMKTKTAFPSLQVRRTENHPTFSQIVEHKLKVIRDQGQASPNDDVNESSSTSDKSESTPEESDISESQSADSQQMEAESQSIKRTKPKDDDIEETNAKKKMAVLSPTSAPSSQLQLVNITNKLANKLKQEPSLKTYSGKNRRKNR